MSRSDEKKQFDKMLHKIQISTSYTSDSRRWVWEQQGLLEELLKVISSPTDDAIGTPGMEP